MTPEPENMKKMRTAAVIAVTAAIAAGTYTVYRSATRSENTPTEITVPSSEVMDTAPDGGCGYSWAYEDLPEISSELDRP
jgi:hypothetical protein